MHAKKLKMTLGIYNFILALVAFFTGALMIAGDYGIFASYPLSWLELLPFNSWLIPGIITILLFGFGNLLAAVNSHKSAKWSLSMSFTLILTLLIQVLLLKEIYLATIEFLLVGIIQAILAVIVLRIKLSNRREYI